MPLDESSDAILVSGGNTGYLSHQFQRSGFAEGLMGLLEERVYFGISAGSAMATPAQSYDPEGLEREGVYYDEYKEAAPPCRGGLLQFGCGQRCELGHLLPHQGLDSVSGHSGVPLRQHLHRRGGELQRRYLHIPGERSQPVRLAGG
jgi:hypothetical protein